MTTNDGKAGKDTKEEKGDGEKEVRREIPGNLPYTTSPGTLKKILEKVITAERPTKVSYDFLDTTLGFSGGSAKQALSIMRRLGLVGADGSPTETYAKFKTESGRPAAALAALRSGFPEIFKRNEYAHRANEQKLSDIVVEITGLTKTDGVARSIIATFLAVQSFLKDAEILDDKPKSREVDENEEDDTKKTKSNPRLDKLGIAYNINVILPETSNVDVFNAIFKSLKENLLQ